LVTKILKIKFIYIFKVIQRKWCKIYNNNIAFQTAECILKVNSLWITNNFWAFKILYDISQYALKNLHKAPKNVYLSRHSKVSTSIRSEVIPKQPTQTDRTHKPNIAAENLALALQLRKKTPTDQKPKIKCLLPDFMIII